MTNFKYGKQFFDDQEDVNAYILEKEFNKQLDLFETDQAQEALDKERALQKVTLEIKEKFGKNAILRALDYTEGATTRARNKQIGGHNA